MKVEAIVARYKKVPIIMHASMGFALLYFIAIDQILSGMVMFICFVLLMLLHELGHAYYAQKYGYHVIEIKLNPICGYCEYYYSEYEEIPVLVHAGGLIVQLILLSVFGCVFLFLKLIEAYDLLQIIKPVTDVFVFYNLLILLFNSLPIKGLDGYSIAPHIARYFKRNNKNYQPKFNQPKTRHYKKSEIKEIQASKIVNIEKMRARKNKR